MSTAKNDFVTGKKKCTLTNINKLASSANTDHFSVSEFDLNELVDSPAIALIGKRGSGKSWLIKNIIQHQLENEKLDEILVFSPTDKMNKFYETFVENVQHKLDFNILEQALKIQEKNIEDGNPKKLLIVFDDCCCQKGEWVKNSLMQNILFNARQYHISYIFAMQFPIGIAPELRSNFDYICLSADDIISNLKRMYDHYAGMFPQFNSFKQVHQSLTENYSTMVIINRGATQTIQEKVKWFKAGDATITGMIPAIIKNDVIFKECPMIFDLGKYPKKKMFNKLNNDMNDSKKINHFEKNIFNADDDNSIDTYMYDQPIKNVFGENIKNFMPNTSPKQINSSIIYGNTISENSFFKSPKKKSNKDKQTLNKQDDVAHAMINLYDHLKDDIKNKNKYDVLFEIVKCNESIIKHSILLDENKINTIISANLKIAEICGMSAVKTDIDLELEDIESISYNSQEV